MITNSAGLERSEAHHDVHDAAVDVGLRGGLSVALDEVGVAGLAGPGMRPGGTRSA